MKKKDKTYSGNDMTTGSPILNIIKYAIPLLIGSILVQLYNFTDSIVVGNFVGETALAAVGTVGVVIWTASAVFVGFSAGAMILVSRFYGANEVEKLTKVVNTCCAITNILAVPVIIFGIIISKPLLHAMHVPADTFDQSHIYMVRSFLGLAPTVGFSLNSGFLRGMGDSKSPLLFLMVSTVINIVLDIVFVAVFHWDVVGVAVATSIAQLAAWLYSIVYIKKHYDWIYVKPFGLKCDNETVKTMVKLGLPIGLNEIMFTTGIMLLQSIVNTHGSVFMAAFNVASKLDALGYMSVDALYLAVTTFVGQNSGAKKYHRIKKSVSHSLISSMIIVEAITALLVIFGHPVMRLFTPEAGVIEAGYGYLIRVMPFYAIVAAFNVLYGYMQGSGETVIPACVNLASVWLVRLPSAYYINNHYGAENIFFCYACGWVFNLTLTAIFFVTKRVRTKIYGLNDPEQNMDD